METDKEGKKIINVTLSVGRGGSEGEDYAGEDTRKKKTFPPTKKSSSNAGGSTLCLCQVNNCNADMTDLKPYYRRHKVCGFHAKATVVLLAGLPKRFCQQCSRFHELSEFDEAKKSCRKRLAGHNERRRKSSYDSH